VDPLVDTYAPSVFSGQIAAVAKAGDWTYTGSGNYHFSLLDVKKLTVPIPAVGGFGFWRVEIGIETRIWNDLGEPILMHTFCSVEKSDFLCNRRHYNRPDGLMAFVRLPRCSVFPAKKDAHASNLFVA
jgi:hypothetical protein